MSAERITELESKLAGRTNSDGSAKLGYARNVVEIRKELARLNALPAAPATTSQDSVDKPSAP